TIGRPLANTQVYLLDGWMQPVPQGATGELYLGGDGLARGYLGRSGLTAERFVPHPFGERAGARLYRTGDVARYLPDGEIEFLGRIDHQIKLRGFRIELGEIETVLATHPSIRQCSVLVREDMPGDKRLVAYVVGEDGRAATTGELRDLIKQKLPEYMIPSVFVMLDTLPLTPNGKVDRKQLPAPEQTRETLEEEFAAPRTAVEEMLAGIWSQVLGVGRIGVRDNLFELGGHSLLATQIISRVRETFHVEVPLRSLFGAPTVAGLARNVEAVMQGASGVETMPLSAVTRDEDLPLSFAQQRLWFIDQVNPGSSAYNIAEAIRLKGRLDIAALEQTLSEVVRRHEVLRTTFSSVEGQARQDIASALAIELPRIDLGGMPEAEREQEARRLAEREAQEPFELARGPLVRATLLQLDEEDHVILFTMHHIISDAWSMGVLVREVAALYEAFLRSEPSPLDELPVQYADFAYWQREWLRGETLEAHLDYWKDQLAGAPPMLEMPTDQPRPSVPTFTGGRHSLSFTEELTASLRALSRQEGSTIFMSLLAAYHILLHHYSGKDDILVGTDVANRNRFEVEQLIGFFVNQLVLRGKVSGDASYREMLAQVRDVTLGAYAHQDLPFDRLVDSLGIERRLRYSPLFQVKLVFQNTPMPSLQLHGLEAGSMGINSGMSRFDLQLTMWDEDGKLRGWFEYNADLFAAATIKGLADDMTMIVQAVATQPDILIGEIDRQLDALQRQREAARKEESKDALSQKYKTVRRKAISVAPAQTAGKVSDGR
ncbi:MAG: condensation domain-containing protein, partial [Acidobacteria bacterium]|nr:condensation domain-containing protein [Acidobacteriota bacterium]